jgi:hypothetical protein
MAAEINERQLPDCIRITREEAMSDHVTDLLKRQMSLRGDTGVARGTKKWYLQNWFVFMVTGGLAALIAWGILEPHFDDMVYIQGKIEALGLQEGLPRQAAPDGAVHSIDGTPSGWIQIRGQKIWLARKTMRFHDEEGGGVLVPTALAEGQEVGVYLSREGLEESEGNLAAFIDPEPPANPPEKASLPIERQALRNMVIALLLFPLVAGLIGLFLGGIDGLICRLPRRAVLSGGVGLVVGFIGGFFAMLVAGMVYMPLNTLAEKEWASAGSLTLFGFFIQVLGRTLAWGLAGMAMGLGQGIALRSKKLFVYGLLGGIIGGLTGGMLFDPIDLLLLGMDKPSAHFSRMIGLVIIGATVGAMIGLVELLARDCWLRMTQGPLAGKEFLVFKDTMKIGSSPKSDIYLFNDSTVAGSHALLRTVGDQTELEAMDAMFPVIINERPVRTARLRHGDQIRIGKTAFLFERKKG